MNDEAAEFALAAGTLLKGWAQPLLECVLKGAGAIMWDVLVDSSTVRAGVPKTVFDVKATRNARLNTACPESVFNASP